VRPSDGRDRYNAPEIVDEYTDVDGLSPAEQHLFDRNLRSGMDILDLGVGAGRTTHLLRSLARRYVGIDYAEGMIERCRQRFPDAEFLVADAADLSPFEDGSFDAVVFSFNGIDTLHPDETRRRCLRECCRVLRDGGVLILSRHNPRAVLEPSHIPAARPDGVAGVARSVYRSARRTARAMLHAPFWRGHGYQFEPTDGGILMARATPGRAIAEIEAVGFEHLETLPSTYPAPGGPLSAYWYYYAFRRP
jgi:SAM-dependent methyltransferase